MTTSRQPVLFLAHGNPMNAIADNPFTQALGALADTVAKPQAVLVVSAHWSTSGTRVLDVAAPPTIHDFGGFPRALYEIEYPAPGSPDLARRVCELAPSVTRDSTWGLDHAAWAVLRHVWPDADVPVVELSVDSRLSPREHYDLGRSLAPLRDEDVLIVGGGNIVHSFAGISWEDGAPAQPWAAEFDAWIGDALVRGDHDALVEYKDRAGAIAQLSVPTDEHYVPLLYTAAASDPSEPVSFPYTGIDMASMSMRCVRIG